MTLETSIWGNVWFGLHEVIINTDRATIKNVGYNPHGLLLNKVKVPVGNITYWSVFLNCIRRSKTVIKAYTHE